MKKKILWLAFCLLLVLPSTGVWAEEMTTVTQEPPQPFSLTFSLNGDGESFTAVIPQVPNGLYSFDGEQYSTNNKKTDCKPNTSYTGFVKYAKTEELEESVPVSDTKTTPKLTVKTPVIFPEEEKFSNSLTVSISCETTGATVYYTTNGTLPTVASQKYIGPFTINATCTVRAIAVKDGFDQSEAAWKYFTKNKIYKRPARYTVYFETNGGSKIEERKVNRNTEIIPPGNPKKEGYSFGGWYADESLTQPYDFTQRLFKNVTLYAKWVPADQQIILQIGKKEAVVFGKRIVNDVAPVEVKDRTMLPARFIAEHLGARVEWIEETETVTITNENIEIVIRVGEHYAERNGEPVKLDSPAFTQGDRTFVPLRFLAESMGAKVDWEEETQTITITK